MPAHRLGPAKGVTGYNMKSAISIRCQILLGLLIGVQALGQAGPPNDNASKYHETLLTRPASSQLFERFVGAWLEHGTLQEMQTFLQSEAATDDATAADQLLLAKILVRQNRTLQARDHLRQAATRFADDVTLLTELANTEARLLNFTAAVKTADRALAGSTSERLADELTQRKGRWLARSGNRKEALATWSALIASRPDDAELREDVIDLLLDESMVDQALEFQVALVERSTDPFLKMTRQLRLGDIYLRAGQLQKAVEIYTKSLVDSGHDSWLEKEILVQIERLFRQERNLTGLRDH